MTEKHSEKQSVRTNKKYTRLFHSNPITIPDNIVLNKLKIGNPSLNKVEEVMPQKPLHNKPQWLKRTINDTPQSKKIKQLIRSYHLHTVCTQARCPNRCECFSRKVATFLIMGSICTRNCLFCNIHQGKVEPLDEEEPMNVAQAIQTLNLKHAVITSVTRDDLEDGGALHYQKTVQAIKQWNPETTIEILTPDFHYKPQYYLSVAGEDILVYNHNIEAAESHFRKVRDKRFHFDKSLEMLSSIKKQYPSLITKTGFMVGLGETPRDVEMTLKQVQSVGVSIVTIGQYLQPSKSHYPVKEYLDPERFEVYKQMGLELGLEYVFAGPLVRSSYTADLLLKQYQEQKQ